MQKVAIDCLGIICKDLEIEDLRNLSYTCKRLYVALNKLSFLWHGKYYSWYRRNFNKIRNKKIRRENQNYLNKSEIFQNLYKYEIQIKCRCFKVIKESTSDFGCKCIRYDITYEDYIEQFRC